MDNFMRFERGYNVCSLNIVLNKFKFWETTKNFYMFFFEKGFLAIANPFNNLPLSLTETISPTSTPRLLPSK